MIRALPIVAACIAMAAPPAFAADAPHTGRAWAYANLTTVVTPNLSLTLMPGTRFEYLRGGADSKGHYFDELFVGPNFRTSLGGANLKLSVWYYLMGFPTAAAYQTAHNFEVVPSVDYRIGPVTLAYRLILHNTFHASVYPDAAQRSGYGLVVRNLFQGRFAVTPGLGLLLGVEPFHGVVEDSEAPPSPIGYWQRGLRLNRVYAGFDWKPTPAVGISPQYVLETPFDQGGRVTEVGHYLFVTVSYLWAPFAK